jgi:AcrR family transcriptional regulator
MEDPGTNKKYRAVLDASKKLFWKHGVRRITVEEICREANVSKMTFYRFFPNKTELAKKVLDRYYDESLVTFRKITRADTTAAEKFRQMIQMKIEASDEISHEFIKDLMVDNKGELFSYFEEKLKFIYSEGVREFKLGQEKGWIRKDLNVDFMFFFFQKSSSFLVGDEALARFTSTQDMILEVTNLLFYGIVPRD